MVHAGDAGFAVAGAGDGGVAGGQALDGVGALAGVIGTRGAWTHTERTETFLGASAPTGNGTRTRTREFVIRPRLGRPGGGQSGW